MRVVTPEFYILHSIVQSRPAAEGGTAGDIAPPHTRTGPTGDPRVNASGGASGAGRRRFRRAPAPRDTEVDTGLELDPPETVRASTHPSMKMVHNQENMLMY